MRIWTRGRKTAGRRRWKKAVTPAIATMLLLVLIITITMMVLIWGLPRIQDMQSEASYKLARSHFESLDNSVYTLSKGSIGDSVSSPMRFSDGTYSIQNDVDYWIISYQLSRTYTILFEDLEDGDNKIVLYEASNQAITGAKVNVSWPLMDNDNDAQDQAIYPKGVKYYFTTKYRVDSATKFTVNLNGQDIAEAWVVSLDMISLQMDTSAGGFEVREINNALLSNYPNHKHVETGPDFQINHDTRTFVANFVKFDINGVSTANRGSYSVNLQLKSVGIGSNPEAKNLRMDFTGDYKEAWYQYFVKHFSLSSMGENSCHFIRETNTGDFQGLLLDTPNEDDLLGLNEVSFKIRINLIQVQTEAMS